MLANSTSRPAGTGVLLRDMTLVRVARADTNDLSRLMQIVGLIRAIIRSFLPPAYPIFPPNLQLVGVCNV